MKRPGTLPPISKPLLHLFARYATSYLKRHFHSLRLLGKEPPNDRAAPLVIYLNHSAWWDPLVGLFLAQEFFATRPAYAPMAATMLERYGFFKALGFIPIESETTRGAAQFLRTAEAILARSESVFFFTPQGGFADVRAPLVFAPGLEHLVARAPQARFVPLAIEYTFWEERKPEVLLAFGEATVGDLRAQLAAVQARLAAAAQRRQPNEWKILLRAKSGVNPLYDFWRSMQARWRGEKFRAEHSRL